MELIILLPTILILAMGLQSCLTAVARRRGRVAPWSINIHTEPPNCVNPRLNWIESLLMVVFAPLGIVLVVAGFAVAFWLSETIGAVMIILGFVLLAARGIFVAACFAYADLAEAPTAEDPA